MSTITIVDGLVADGDSAAVQILAGRYMFAAGGAFGGGTLTFNVNIGPAIGVPVTDMSYTAPGAEIVWLPACTAFVTLVDSTSADINVALSAVTVDTV